LIIGYANLITLSRLAIIPFLIFTIEKDYYIISGILVLFAIFSDWLDGIIARRYNDVTQHGKLLDPAVDKIFTISLIGVFIEKGYINTYPLFLIVTREMLVTWIRSVMVSKGTVVPAYSLGKIKTTFQMLSIFLLAVKFITLGVVVLWISIVVSYISGFDYLKIFYKEKAWT
jgi:CDP-diacylglycerol--glycerol-3-phosphate 3-phosphatidyltransferase